MKSSKASAVHQKVLKTFRDELQPSFGVFDAARDPEVLRLLRASKEEFQSLFETVKGEALSHFAPYLVRFRPQSSLLEALVGKGWGKSWGVYLVCDSSIQDLRNHLRRFLMVKNEEGEDLYFRFYDPRVLRVFLPSCTTEESYNFFGPIDCYVTEDEKADVVLKFVNRRDPSRAT